MPLFTDPTPTWLKDPSVLDEPWQKAIRSLVDLPIVGSMIPVELEDQLLAVGMPKTPLGRDVPDAIYKKLMSIKNPKIRNEVDRLGMAYDVATSPEHKKALGKRLAELHRIGTGGKAFNPSIGVQTPMPKDLSQYIPDSPEIYKARLKALQKAGPKRKK